jgi:hypothetical protein
VGGSLARIDVPNEPLRPGPVGGRIEVAGFHPVFRVGSDGHLLVELVAQFQQLVPDSEQEFGGIPLRGGTTIIAGGDGRVKYVIAKPLPSATGLDDERRDAAQLRKNRQQEYLQLCDLTDPMMPYYGSQEFARRMQLRMSFAGLHRGTNG